MNFKLTKKSIVIASAIMICILVFAAGAYAYDQYDYKQRIEKTKDSLFNKEKELLLIKEQIDLLKSDSPHFLKANLTPDEIDKVKSSIHTFKDPKFDFDIEENDLKITIQKLNTEKEALKLEIEEISNKFSIQEKVNSLFNGEEKAIDGKIVSKNIVIADDLNEEKVIEIKNLMLVDDEAKDIDEWQTVINSLVEEAETQLIQIEAVTKSLGIYNDGKVAEGVTRKDYEAIKLEVEKVKNEKAHIFLSETLTKIDLYLKEKEKEEAERKEAEKREAEKLKREKEKQQNAATKSSVKNETTTSKSNNISPSSNSKIVELKVPYYNQYQANAPMGCEASALLQALHYKGYAKNHTLASFLKEMPVDEAGNPHNGFGGTPYKVVSGIYQSIYPVPLSAWGSKYGSVSNITGSSVENLKQQLDNGNPVIVYVTMNWRSPQYGNYFWGKGIDNAHVMTLTGYKDGFYHVTDPAAGKYWVKASAFESSYNLTKYAVVVY